MEPTHHQPEKSTIRPLAAELGRMTTVNAAQNDTTILLKNGWLEITAHVNANGLHELIGMLTHYEAIVGRIGEWNKPLA